MVPSGVALRMGPSHPEEHQCTEETGPRDCWYLLPRLRGGGSPPGTPRGLRAINPEPHFYHLSVCLSPSCSVSASSYALTFCSPLCGRRTSKASLRSPGHMGVLLEGSSPGQPPPAGRLPMLLHRCHSLGRSSTPSPHLLPPLLASSPQGSDSLP